MFSFGRITDIHDPHSQELARRLQAAAGDTEETYRLFDESDGLSDLIKDDSLTMVCLDKPHVTAAAQYAACGSGFLPKVSFVINRWGGGNLIRHKGKKIDHEQLGRYPGYDQYRGGNFGYLKRIQRFAPHTGAVQTVLEMGKEHFDFIELTTWNEHAYDRFLHYGFLDTGLVTGAVSEYKIMTWAK